MTRYPVGVIDPGYVHVDAIDELAALRNGLYLRRRRLALRAARIRLSKRRSHTGGGVAGTGQ